MKRKGVINGIKGRSIYSAKDHPCLLSNEAALADRFIAQRIKDVEVGCVRAVITTGIRRGVLMVKDYQKDTETNRFTRRVVLNRAHDSFKAIAEPSTGAA
jgi:hypothetical protein